MLKLPNIYKKYDLRLLIAVPIILLLVGLYFSSYITLDTSLKGGVSVLLQTNSSANPAEISSAVSSSLHTSGVEVASSPGGYQVTIPMNDSIANGESYLEEFYSFKSNYSQYEFNATSAIIGLQSNPNNSTLTQALAVASKGQNETFAQMRYSLSKEHAALIPLIGNDTYNSSSVGAMGASATSFYNNASAVYRNRVLSSIRGVVPFTSFSYQQVTPTLGAFFLSQVQLIIIVAFILVSLVVLLVFKSIAPAVAVVFGAGNDMIIALGAMGLFGIPLGLASLGGLLMLIGYSIDTDMLAAIRMLKRHDGDIEDRAFSAMHTGMTMTLTAIVSFAILFIVSLIAYVPTYYEISGVVLFGLIGDVFTTWLGNTPMILLYKKRKAGRK
jgi:preprotein translocase subunit SecF